MNSSWTEDDLLAGVSAGSEEASCAFDAAFRPQLLHFARKRGFNREDAEDVVQDTLIASVQQIREHKFERRAALSSWVLSIFARRCAEAYRRRLRRDRSGAVSEDVELIAQQTSGRDH